MMKKIVALLLAVLMIVGMTACANKSTTTPDASAETPAVSNETPAASNETPSGDGLEYIEGTNLLAGKPFEGTTLNIMSCAAGDAQFENLKRWTESEFTPLTGITVVWEHGAYAEMQGKMVTEAIGGTSTYDVWQVNDTWGPSVRNYCLPLDEYIARDGVDTADFAPSVLEVGKMGGDGTQYGIPFRGHFMSIFYRTDVYEELGLSIPTTWDELIANCKIIQEKTDLDGMSVPYGINAEQNLMPWYCFMYSMGGSFFDENYNVEFNNDASLASFEKYVGLLTKEGIVSTDNITLTEGDSGLRLAHGLAAHFMGWSWQTQKFINPEISNPELVDKIGCFRVPSFDGVNESTNTVTMWTAAIPANCKQADAAWEYIKWMTSAQTEWNVLTDKSVYDTVICVHNSNLSKPEISDVTHGAMAYGYEGFNNSRIPPLFDDWAPISEALQIAMNNAANGADCKTELDAAAKQATKILEDAGYY